MWCNVIGERNGESEIYMVSAAKTYLIYVTVAIRTSACLHYLMKTASCDEKLRSQHFLSLPPWLLHRNTWQGSRIAVEGESSEKVGFPSFLWIESHGVCWSEGIIGTIYTEYAVLLFINLFHLIHVEQKTNWDFRNLIIFQWINGKKKRFV